MDYPTRARALARHRSAFGSGESRFVGLARAFSVFRAAPVTACALIALAVGPGLALTCRSAAAAEDPHQVKADMLYNIAKFIRWPDHSFDQTHGQLVITILGEDPLAEALAATLSTRSINGHPVFVRMVRRVQDAAGSQIVYIASSEAGRMAEVLRAMEGSPALTVADSTGFVAVGGMVDFTNENERVRFEINQARAEHAGLRISAKLLALAHVFEPTP